MTSLKQKSHTKMAEKLSAKLLNGEAMERSESDEGSTSSSDISDSFEVYQCEKLKLPDNIAAYIENKELTRNIDTVTCDSSVVQKAISNYIVVKKILSNLSWQEQHLCKHVCTTWRSAINTLLKEQMSAFDFVLDMPSNPQLYSEFKKSKNVHGEPLAVLTFANSRGFNMAKSCGSFSPCTCSRPCKKRHCLMDVVHHHLTAPKNCMLTVVASYLSYMPLQQSITSQHTIRRQKMFSNTFSFVGGLHIPLISDVEFHVLNIKHLNRNTIDMKKDFFEEIDKLAQTRIFKGVLVYVTEKFLLHSVEDIVFLDHIKKVQPDIPYALGGCIVEETMFERSDIHGMVDNANIGTMFVSENFISVALFSVPKNGDNAESQTVKNNFNMYSLVIESSEGIRSKIEKCINEFAKKVQHHEHSVALKLSCIGRDQKHEVEQNYFRAAFPNTPLIGCYGNGELGINHPERPTNEDSRAAKRHKYDPGPQGIMYSYSTVFIYIGWGKVISVAES